MHGNLTGAYDIRHVKVRNRIVLTNKTPTGLNRGFGGPQMYFPLERLMQRDRDRAETRSAGGHAPQSRARRRPCRTGRPPAALLDSGDFAAALAAAVADGRLEELQARRDAARAQGRHYGIGFAAVVEPSVSNMGYITAALTPEERRRAGPKNGAQSTATISLDPLGAVSVQVASTPQGQGHRTVLAQVVADALGLEPQDIRVVADVDTAKDAWSIASGNYSSRFAPAVAGAARSAAVRLRDRLARLAAAQLNVSPAEIVFADGRVAARANPDNAHFLRAHRRGRALGARHDPGRTRSDDPRRPYSGRHPNSPRRTKPTRSTARCATASSSISAASRSIAASGAVRIDSYVTMHDCGRILHPAMVAGQISGGFAQALGAALYEEYVYTPEGDFLSGTFADYLLPTTMEVPEPIILHRESPSPFTPLGAKGVGEGNCMSTPVCIANAVADALGLDALDLPATPAKLAAHIHGPEPPRAEQVEPRAARER